MRGEWRGGGEGGGGGGAGSGRGEMAAVSGSCQLQFERFLIIGGAMAGGEEGTPSFNSYAILTSNVPPPGPQSQTHPDPLSLSPALSKAVSNIRRADGDIHQSSTQVQPRAYGLPT